MTPSGGSDSRLLDYAFDELLWISEAPNRNENLSADALALAEYARRALAPIEAAAKEDEALRAEGLERVFLRAPTPVLAGQSFVLPDGRTGKVDTVKLADDGRDAKITVLVPDVER
jgi:hypothetical protein